MTKSEKTETDKSKKRAKDGKGKKKAKYSDSKTETKKKEKKSKNLEKKKRYFKLYDIKTNIQYGRYKGYIPKQAASKAFTKFLRRLKKEGLPVPRKPITIYLRESTQRSSHKFYAYKAWQDKLNKPQILETPDQKTGEPKTIVYHYRNKIHKAPVPEHLLKMMKKKRGSKSGKKTKKAKKAGGSKTVKNNKHKDRVKNKNTMKKKKTTKKATKSVSKEK